MTYVDARAIVVQAVFTTLCVYDVGRARTYLISDALGHGRVFDGIGAISGGSVSM